MESYLREVLGIIFSDDSESYSYDDLKKKWDSIRGKSSSCHLPNEDKTEWYLTFTGLSDNDKAVWLYIRSKNESDYIRWILAKYDNKYCLKPNIDRINEYLQKYGDIAA